jgi:molybdopterin-guanine dinucleotide biosynthesis protein A
MQSLKVLILAGGHSSRMGSPKHLLPLPDGPLYLRLVRSLHDALPNTTTHHISFAQRSVLDGPLLDGVVRLPGADNAKSSSIELKIIADDAHQDIGPAAGLLAAYHHDPAATWLVVACDYPLLQSATVHQLIDHYEAPVTCFRNADGFSEPLLGIWSPQALESLQENVGSGRTGPSFTVKKLDGKLIVPIDEGWLVNVNTKQDWEAVKVRLQDGQPEDELCG